MTSRTTECADQQFTQTDPMPLGAGSVFESAYAYALNNPAVYTDPSGLRANTAAGRGSSNPIADGHGATISGSRVPFECLPGSRTFWQSCLFARRTGSRDLSGSSLSDLGLFGSILKAYSFSGEAEGVVTSFGAELFGYEGPGNFAIRRGVLTKLAITAGAMFGGDGTKPGPSFGLKKKTVAYRLSLESGVEYAHNQPWQRTGGPLVSTPPGVLRAFSFQDGFSKLLAGKWVEYSGMRLDVSFASQSDDEE